MYRMSALRSLSAAALLVTLMACTTHPSERALKKVRLLTGSKGNYYYCVGQALQASLRDRGIELDVEPSFGSKDNIDKLNRSEAEFAIAQADAAHRAWYGELPFTRADQTLKLVAPLFTEKVQIPIPPHLYFSSPVDLKGKRIWLGPPGSGHEVSAKAMLMASGFTPEEIEKSRYDISPTVANAFDEAAELLRKGTIAAVFQTTAVPNEPIRRKLAELDLRLLGLDWKTVEKLVADGVYIEASLQKTEYPLLTEGIFTVGVQTLLVTRGDIADDVVKVIAESLQRDQKSIEAELEHLLLSKVRGPERIEPAKLTLLGIRPAPQFLKRVHPAARDALPNWPIRKDYVHDILALGAVLVAIAILGMFFPGHRKAAIRHVGRHVRVYLPLWLYVSGSIILLLIGAVWLRALEGELNEHFATLPSSALSLAESALDKVPGQLLHLAPVPTTRGGQTAMSVSSWIVLLPLVAFGPLIKRKLGKFLGSRTDK